ncbi:hypothetical protein M3Y97_00990500 [Aphelenchoides bicaudatus]|nr:hypothetical protein M3Y97_00990500 [Aphelenchoides bicaudatus]
MQFFKLSTLLFVLLVAVPLLAKPVNEDEPKVENEDDEVENLHPQGFHPFTLGKSNSLSCPERTGADVCPTHTFAYYYACCNDKCCMQIQQWILFSFGLFVLAAISFVIGRCIYHFCFKNRNVKK